MTMDEMEKLVMEKLELLMERRTEEQKKADENLTFEEFLDEIFDEEEDNN